MTTEIIQRGVSAAKWGASSTLLRFLLQIVAQAIMARLLGPEAYGVFGAGVIIMAMTSLLTDIGFSWSLLRRSEVSAADVQFVLTAQIGFGALLGILLYAGSEFLAHHLTNEPVGWVIRLLAFSVVFNAASSTPAVLLSRDLNYRELGKGQLISYIAGYFLTGIPMALAGCGTLSLVSAFLVQSVARCAMLFRFSGLLWRPTLKHLVYKSFLADGILIFLTNIVNWLAYNLDRVTVSKLMPSQALGIYNVSANLAGTPNALLLGSIQPVFLATSTKMQDKASLCAAYVGVMRAALLISPVFYLTLALGAESLVHVLYGDKWADAAKVMAILFLGMPFFVIWSLSTPILWSTGKPREEVLFQLPIVLFAAAAFYTSSSFGLSALAMVADFVLFLRAAAMFIAASRRVSLDWRELVSVSWVGAAFMLMALSSSLMVKQITAPGFLRLLLTSMLTIVACLALLRFLPYRLSRDAIETVGHASGKAAFWLHARRDLGC